MWKERHADLTDAAEDDYSVTGKSGDTFPSNQNGY